MSYDKKIWETGDVITAGDLNNIENGVKNLDEAVENIDNDLENNYAKVDGYYETMAVGNAEQLISNVGVEESTPYLFRTTGGNADVGDRVKFSEITGGTVAWNQLVQNGDFANGTAGWSTRYGSVSVSNNEATIVQDASSQALSLVADIPNLTGHKLLVSFDAKSADIPNIRLRKPFQSASRPLTSSYTSFSFVGVYTESDFVVQGLKIAASADGSFTIRNIVLFDLTQMFGSTIADYLYTLESGTAGAGVAWFKSLFPKDYYAYDAGSLQSVQTSAHKTIGFNQWDEEWEAGGISLLNGANTTTSGYYRSTNYIPCLSDTTYYIKAPVLMQLLFYDAGKTYISTYHPERKDNTFVTPENACYMRFRNAANDTWTPYQNDICINLHWDGERDDEYEPYELHTYALDDSLTLRGVPKLDANNDLYYDGDVYESDGAVTRKYGIVDLGTLEWSWQSTWEAWYSVLPLAKRPDNIFIAFNAISGKYISSSQASMIDNHSMTENVCKTSGSDVVVVRNGSNETKPSGHLVYELATATTESAEPYQETQVCDDFGTEEFVDSRDVPVPVGYTALYQSNLRAKLEMAPDSPDGNGDYIVRQTNGLNEYVPFVKELPSFPSDNGIYALKLIVVNGVATKSWVEETT